MSTRKNVTEVVEEQHQTQTLSSQRFPGGFAPCSELSLGGVSVLGVPNRIASEPPRPGPLPPKRGVSGQDRLKRGKALPNPKPGFGKGEGFTNLCWNQDMQEFPNPPKPQEFPHPQATLLKLQEFPNPLQG
eukprot:2260660-Amphidinium_carterae.1